LFSGYGLTVHTPNRVFILSCETFDLRDRWVKSINDVSWVMNLGQWFSTWSA